MAILGSDNHYAGGITFSTPALQLGNFNNAAPNGGFNFDLPLSTVANMNQQALTFASANSAANRNLIGGVFSGAQNSVNATSGAAFNFMHSGMNSLVQNSSATNQATAQLFDKFLGTTSHLGNISVENTKAANRRGCFITTAVCENEGKADDCAELTKLRNFRDTFMLSDSKRREDVAEYYEKAPAIVSAISRRADSAQCFAMLNEYFIQPAIVAIDAGDYELAYSRYVSLFVVAKTMAQGV